MIYLGPKPRDCTCPGITIHHPSCPSRRASIRAAAVLRGETDD